MQVLPPDFPEEITFSYLFDKCWSYVKTDIFKIFLFSVYYFVMSIVINIIPIIGAILSHVFFFGIVYSMNEFRLNEKFLYSDLFWGMQNFNRLKNIFMISIPFIPILILGAIFGVFYQQLSMPLLITCSLILFLGGIYATLILLLSTFVLVLENEDYMKTIIRSHQLIKGNALDISIVIVWICFLNIGGLATIIGITITAPLSALIMLELCRFLIRQYELKELMI